MVGLVCLNTLAAPPLSIPVLVDVFVLPNSPPVFAAGVCPNKLVVGLPPNRDVPTGQATINQQPEIFCS